MRVAEKLLNKAEEVAFRELNSIAEDNALRLFAKPRLSDVLLKDESLSRVVFDFYTKAHVDFVVTDQATKPLFIVEYDGPFHTSAVQRQRDETKDSLCSSASLGVLRINANHVTRRFRGISVLRWIIEVTELGKWFHDAQQAGRVPWDADFDAMMVFDDGKGRKWPYWLSVLATQRLNDFVHKTRSGWAGITGHDEENNLHELSFIWFDNSVIWSKTAVRHQRFDFPAYDLLREISICEIESKLREYQEGKCQPISGTRFQQVCERFCSRYDAHPSHSCGMGSAPFSYSWNFNEGWKFAQASTG
jgi:very-short-patch-repair endonuclease